MPPSATCCLNTYASGAISPTQRFYKKAAAFVLRAVAKHSPELAQVRNCSISRSYLHVTIQELLCRLTVTIIIPSSSFSLYCTVRVL